MNHRIGQQIRDGREIDPRSVGSTAALDARPVRVDRRVIARDAVGHGLSVVLVVPVIAE
jgi:hypothetical protein